LRAKAKDVLTVDRLKKMWPVHLNACELVPKTLFLNVTTATLTSSLAFTMDRRASVMRLVQPSSSCLLPTNHPSFAFGTVLGYERICHVAPVELQTTYLDDATYPCQFIPVNAAASPPLSSFVSDSQSLLTETEEESDVSLPLPLDETSHSTTSPKKLLPFSRFSGPPSSAYWVNNVAHKEVFLPALENASDKCSQHLQHEIAQRVMLERKSKDQSDLNPLAMSFPTGLQISEVKSLQLFCMGLQHASMFGVTNDNLVYMSLLSSFANTEQLKEQVKWHEDRIMQEIACGTVEHSRLKQQVRLLLTRLFPLQSFVVAVFVFLLV
jgi:hypothetical protein